MAEAWNHVCWTDVYQNYAYCFNLCLTENTVSVHYEVQSADAAQGNMIFIMRPIQKKVNTLCGKMQGFLIFW